MLNKECVIINLLNSWKCNDSLFCIIVECWYIFPYFRIILSEIRISVKRAFMVSLPKK